MVSLQGWPHEVISEPEWRSEGSYPPDDLIRLIEGGRPAWAAWLKEECESSMEEGRESYAQLLVEDIEEEVVLIELDDGRVDIWDGWHSVASAIVKGA